MVEGAQRDSGFSVFWPLTRNRPRRRWPPSIAQRVWNGWLRWRRVAGSPLVAKRSRCCVHMCVDSSGLLPPPSLYSLISSAQPARPRGRGWIPERVAGGYGCGLTRPLRLPSLSKGTRAGFQPISSRGPSWRDLTRGQLNGCRVWATLPLQ